MCVYRVEHHVFRVENAVFRVEHGVFTGSDGFTSPSLEVRINPQCAESGVLRLCLRLLGLCAPLFVGTLKCATELDTIQ